jgi:uncharacterized protein
MELWTAFTLGFLGSFHCVGMCGPIALALPGGGPHGGNSKLHFVINRLSYNIGRITTYALIGLLFGLLGKGFAFAGLQKSLSVALGVLVLAMAFLPAAFTQSVNPAGKLGKGVGWLKKKMQGQFRRRGRLAVYTIGVLNGLLPCGLVYLAAAGALTQSAPWLGSAYMAAFGAGTLPAMLVLAFAGNFMSLHWRNGIRRMMPVATVVVGLLLIVRGLELGIPYLSPILGLLEKGMTMCGIK